MPESEKINQMFAEIAPKYDLANRLLSGGLDRWWRWRLGKLVKACNPSRVLDLATGSGDVAFELERQLPEGVAIIGIDFCKPMLEMAKKKSEQRKPPSRVMFQIGDCQKLELPDGGVDVVTIAFGIRNVENRLKAFQEMNRVLNKSEGKLFILEFSQPQGFLKPLYCLYLKYILPHLAQIITGHRAAYQYLGVSIEGFPAEKALAEELRQGGFTEIKHHPLTGGIATIHEAKASKRCSQ